MHARQHRWRKVVSMGASSEVSLTQTYIPYVRKFILEVHTCVLVSVVLNYSWRKISTTILAGRRYGIFILYYSIYVEQFPLLEGRALPPENRNLQRCPGSPLSLHLWRQYCWVRQSQHMIIRLLDLSTPPPFHGVVDFFMWRFPFGNWWYKYVKMLK